MNSKLLGGILLVIGTTIGAGMLALPTSTAQLGFWGSTILLTSAWMVMTICSFLFLEVNLSLPTNTNIISMAGATLGRIGQAVAWVVYLLLLYSIICAYISGGGDLFQYLLSIRGIHASSAVASILFTFMFGLVVYFGMRSVDYVNRGLMVGKLGALFLLVLLIFPFVSPDKLMGGQLKYITSSSSITVAAVAFGSLLIIPSLRTYFGEDVKSLRKAILIGTFIPLICYIAWNMVIMGVIPLNGNPGLVQMLTFANTNSALVSTLSSILNSKTISSLAQFFTSICMATSFLSVSLSLSDFLADGLRITKQGLGSVVVYGGTFLPPVLIVLFYPNVFIRGLNYAGISCFILMVLMPPLMVWSGRYYRGTLSQEGYEIPGGKFLLAALVLFATLMIVFGLQGMI
ncbi:MAG: tryptophan/tyrosine permease [Gammaproteobacteria bacterium RIFCSPHIGHO2_12_FULL_37_34]|nr:MAG: tryptophan/tyrosine permease [Gammaproteobacteria bacterium RIFCSPHIGHO2_12_FULL_37_34]